MATYAKQPGVEQVIFRAALILAIGSSQLLANVSDLLICCH